MSFFNFNYIKGNGDYCNQNGLHSVSAFSNLLGIEKLSRYCISKNDVVIFEKGCD